MKVDINAVNDAVGRLSGMIDIDTVKDLMGRFLGPVYDNVRRGAAGRGGSAQLAGTLAEWANAWRSGRILLGRSIHDPGRLVGYGDNEHLITVAGTGGGKGRSVIIPNLLLYPHSVVVTDPKGTNAAVTAAARSRFGKVYVLDPFDMAARVPSIPKGVRFNPLRSLDPSSLTFVEEVKAIADGIVIPETSHGPGASFFESSARGLIAGAIAHVKTRDPQFANLGNVRDLLTSPDLGKEEGETLTAMINNHRGAGLAKEAAAQLISAGDRTRGDIIATALMHTDFLASPAMRDLLSDSDFDLGELKRKPTTVYLVIPGQFLQQHARFLRLFSRLALSAGMTGLENGAKPVPIVMILDEFHALGRIDVISNAAALIRSFKVRVWPFLQNLGQLKELYRDNWETFWGNSGAVQLFSMTDLETLEHVTRAVGKHLITDRGRSGETMVRGAASLRDPQELAREISRDSGRCLILGRGKDPMLLRREDYDRSPLFRKGDYNPDPDHA